MTLTVMAYFFKNYYYLKADVYDKGTLHFYLLFFLTKMKYKEKIFSISLFPVNHSNTVLLLITGLYKLKYPILVKERKYLFTSSNYINRLSMMYCTVMY